MRSISASVMSSKTCRQSGGSLFRFLLALTFPFAVFIDNGVQRLSATALILDNLG